MTSIRLKFLLPDEKKKELLETHEFKEGKSRHQLAWGGVKISIYEHSSASYLEIEGEKNKTKALAKSWNFDINHNLLQ